MQIQQCQELIYLVLISYPSYHHQQIQLIVFNYVVNIYHAMRGHMLQRLRDLSLVVLLDNRVVI